MQCIKDNSSLFSSKVKDDFTFVYPADFSMGFFHKKKSFHCLYTCVCCALNLMSICFEELENYTCFRLTARDEDAI